MRRRLCVHFRRVLLASLLTKAMLPSGIAATTQSPTEYQVKAAFLLNFTKFVAWPPGEFVDPESPLAICVVGDDPFGSTLDAMVQGERVGEHKLVVRRLRSMKPDAGCQVLFFGNSARDVHGILGGLNTAVLTVGESPDFLQEGGMIQFVVENRRIRFDINKRAADEAGLRLSSKLLSVARSVSN